MLAVLAQAVATFVVTNIDDILLLALFFGQAGGDRTAERRVVIGQFAGFGALLTISVLAASVLRLLPEDAIAYLGLIPLALGVRAAISAWRHRGDDAEEPRVESLTIGKVATVTFSNGGDNIGVYVPVFTAAGPDGTALYAVVFLVMVAVWCFLGRYSATRPVIARALTRWGHVLLPVVLISIGSIIVIEGGAFGL